MILNKVNDIISAVKQIYVGNERFKDLLQSYSAVDVNITCENNNYTINKLEIEDYHCSLIIRPDSIIYYKNRSPKIIAKYDNFDNLISGKITMIDTDDCNKT